MERSPNYHDQTRETIIKSSLTGVAATVMAVTVFSPAGLGGLVGASFASGSGHDINGNDAYANLPAYPAPLSAEELSNIHSSLARTAASLEITRAATQDRIEHLQSIALTDGVVSFGAASHAEAASGPNGLRLALSETVAQPTAIAMAAPQTQQQVRVAAAAPVQAITPVNYTADPALALGSPFRDSNRELGELLLTHELL